MTSTGTSTSSAVRRPRFAMAASAFRHGQCRNGVLPGGLPGYRRDMQQWQVIPVTIGGVVAVGFLDEERLLVGSHSGVGVFDVHSGEKGERTHDEHYNWYQGDPPWIRYPSQEGVRLVRAAGLRGGELDQTTIDGWTCH